MLNVGSTAGSCDQQALETDRIQLKDTITSLRIQLDGLKVENANALVHGKTIDGNLQSSEETQSIASGMNTNNTSTFHLQNRPTSVKPTLDKKSKKERTVLMSIGLKDWTRPPAYKFKTIALSFLSGIEELLVTSGNLSRRFPFDESLSEHSAQSSISNGDLTLKEKLLMVMSQTYPSTTKRSKLAKDMNLQFLDSYHQNEDSYLDLWRRDGISRAQIGYAVPMRAEGFLNKTGRRLVPSGSETIMFNKIKGNPQLELQEKRVIDSGCSRHMTGNQTNGNASTKENIDAGQARKKIVPDQEYILVPLLTSDPSLSKSSKDSPDAGL
ncbi:hypothetical protein Tco_0775772 [Tanacetum coccineum]